MQILNNLKAHWRLYGLLGLFIGSLFLWSYHALFNAVKRGNLINESVLRLQGGNVRRTQNMVRDRQPSGGTNRGADVSSTKESYTPPEATVTITPKDPNKRLEDVVDIKVKKFGFIFFPGLEATAIPPGLGLDFKWLYVYRFGSTFGVNYFNLSWAKWFSPTLGVTYHPFANHLRNTDLVAGFAPIGPIPVYLGIRVSF